MSGPLLLPDNPMVRVLTVTAAFEVVVYLLSIFVMTNVSEVGVGTALAAAGTGALLAAVAAARTRTPLGQWAGWLAVVAGVAMGLLTPGMFVMGGMFALLWVTCVVLGKRLETGAVDNS